MRFRVFAIAMLLAPSLTLTAASADAEWFVDLYAGGAFTQKDDVKTVVTTEGFGSGTLNLKDIKFDNSYSVGGRAGYWFAALPYVGLGLDVSHFRPDIGAQKVDATIFGLPGTVTLLDDMDVRVVAVSLDLMLRWPLMKTAEFPNGRLQPYVTAGPAIFFTEAEFAGDSDSDRSLGFKAGAGVTFLITKILGVFGEYRFTRFSPEFKFTSGGSSSKFEPDINTHHLLVGASLRF